jgi:hypothetical protein
MKRIRRKVSLETSMTRKKTPSPQQPSRIQLQMMTGFHGALPGQRRARKALSLIYPKSKRRKISSQHEPKMNGGLGVPRKTIKSAKMS